MTHQNNSFPILNIIEESVFGINEHIGIIDSRTGDCAIHFNWLNIDFSGFTK